MKKFLKWVGKVLLVIVLLLVVGVAVLTIAEYRPKDVETVIADHGTEAVLETGKPLTVVSWNCGYGALGDNADFFMDGGSSVYTADKERVMQNLGGIRDVLKAQDADLIILQEVDIRSSRSHQTDERTTLREALPGASEAFAYNFNSMYVPYPWPPIGHVESGLYTLSRAEIREAERISLPCPFSWPIRTVNLKRCLLVSRIPVAGTEKELVLINLHLEAYDDGEGKEAQTRQLISFMQAEADKGNYVIVGGDFNQIFSNVDSSAYPLFKETWQPGLIDVADFGSSFSLYMDNRVPSCRSLDRAYAGEKDEDFQFYIIDGFILSSNVEKVSLETLDEHFACSDHNPVKLVCTLKPEDEKAQE